MKKFEKFNLILEVQDGGVLQLRAVEKPAPPSIPGFLTKPAWFADPFPHAKTLLHNYTWGEMLEGAERGGRRALLEWAARGPRTTVKDVTVTYLTACRAQFCVAVLTAQGLLDESA